MCDAAATGATAMTARIGASAPWELLAEALCAVWPQNTDKLAAREADVSPAAVRKWRRGDTKAADPVLRLLENERFREELLARIDQRKAANAAARGEGDGLDREGRAVAVRPDEPAGGGRGEVDRGPGRARRAPIAADAALTAWGR